MTTEQLSQPLSAYTATRHSRLFGLPLTLTQYVISADKLSEQSIFFAVTAKAVALSHVRTSVLSQSPLQKLFHLYTVHVATADPAVPEFLVRNIRNGEQFAATLQKATESALSLRPTVTA